MIDQRPSNHQEPLPDIVLAVWKRRKWIAVGAFILALVMGTAFTFGLPDLYSSSTTLVIEDSAGKTGDGSGIDALEKRFEVARQRMMSRDEILDLVSRFGLYHGEDFDSRDDLADRFRDDLKIEHDESAQQWRPDSVIVAKVTFESLSPHKAYEVANAVADRLVHLDRAHRVDQAVSQRKFLERQLVETREELAIREQEIESFRDQFIEQLPEQQGVTMAKLRRLGDELRANRERQIELIERRQFEGETGSDELAGLPPSTQLANLKIRLETLRRSFTDKHPDVARLVRRIENLEQNIDSSDPSLEAASEDAADRGSLMAMLEREERQLRSEIAELEGRLGTAPTREYELRQLDRSYDNMRDRYVELVDRYNNAAMVDSLQREPTQEFRILEAAAVPMSPDSPGKMKLLAVVLMLSVGAAGALVLLVEYIDDSFHTTRELQAFVNLPILGALPRITTRADRFRSSCRRLLLTGGFLIAAVALGAGAFIVGQTSAPLAFLI